MRRAHILKCNARAESPNECIFFDTETNSTIQPDGAQKLTLNFGQAVHITKKHKGKWSFGDWFKFTSASEFWDWVFTKTRPKTKLYIFAHNLVFDMTIVHGFTILQERKWLLHKAIVEDPPTILNYRQGKCSICLLDTFNWFSSSLKELGNGIGLPKLEMPPLDAVQSVWDYYTYRDVEIIKSAMLSYLEFVQVNDLGNFQKTAASQAFSAYRHRFMKHQILIDSNEKALDLARKSYYGGRTEAFFIGEQEGDYYLLDVNSMYPFVMAANDFPTKLKAVYHRITTNDIESLLTDYQVVVDVTVKTHEPCYPYQTKTGLMFPTGEFRVTLPSPEFIDAWHRHRIVKVHGLVAYEHKPLFRDYVQTLFALRLKYKSENHLPYNLLCKIMLNSLYGKFGQRGFVYGESSNTESTAIRNWTEYDGDTGQIQRFRQFGGLVQQYHTDGEAFNSHPAISAHVTSYARMWLWKLITTAGRENVYYVDTDSLVVNRKGYDTLIALFNGNDLGELKLERQFSHLIIHGPKDYEFGDVKKIKGVRKNAKQLSENQYQQDSFSKFKGMVRSGDLDTMAITRVSKTLKRAYTKGAVGLNGWVTPWNLPDDLMYIDPVKPRKYPVSPIIIDPLTKSVRQARREDMQENFDRGRTLDELALRAKSKRQSALSL